MDHPYISLGGLCMHVPPVCEGPIPTESAVIPSLVLNPEWMIPPPPFASPSPFSFLSRPLTFTCVTGKSLLLASSLNHCSHIQQMTTVHSSATGLTVSPGLCRHCPHMPKTIHIHIILNTLKYINYK